jgi:hypothetical protein
MGGMAERRFPEFIRSWRGVRQGIRRSCDAGVGGQSRGNGWKLATLAGSRGQDFREKKGCPFAAAGTNLRQSWHR